MNALAPTNNRVPSLLFPLTVFLAAFLLFSIEPLFTKLILPRFGGAAAVWAACLVFFQCAMLLGYLYAHVTSRRMRPLRQAQLHIALWPWRFCSYPLRHASSSRIAPVAIRRLPFFCC